MAKLTARGCDAAQISPEISDDEVFETDSDTVWRPLRTNGLSSEVSHQTLYAIPLEKSEETQSSADCTTPHQQNNDLRTQNELYKADEKIWSYSSFCQHRTPNENIGPSGLCSVVKSESSQYFRTGSENVPSASHGLQSRRPQMHHLDRQHSIVDGLLFEIYDRWHGRRADSFDSDTFTECSSTSEVFHNRYDSSYETTAENRHARQFNRSFLESQSAAQLRRLVHELQRSISQVSGRLVRQLKRRDRRLAKLARNSDVVTAILQAASLKRQIDTRMKFSVTPPPGQSAFDQWKDAMKAVNRLPMGLPPEFRKKVWLSLADHYIHKLKIDWHKTVRLAFNERSNPDDDKLGMQIVKDLHRTGCSSFSGQDNEEDRAVLKRVLLAYARWNKRIGYCQGFNVIAALLLNVMERKEDDALKVMIYLIDHVLPESYFDNNLRALSVDMAVFRDLLRLTLPTLSRHLDRLQHAAQDINTGACYEPPLTNVFTMQWFLTLFATCLPKQVVLRVWDAILLEGSEVLLRTALCLWGKLARRIMKVDSADEFYSLMGELSSDMMEGTIFNSDDMIKAIYAIAPFPFPQLTELREKYTYNIRPFSSNPAPSRKASRMAKAVLYSDEDELDEEEMRAITSFPGMSPVQSGKGKGTDISLVGPGAYGAESEMGMGSRDSVYMERMSTDITALKMQYDKLRQRQRQAHVLIAAAASAKKAVEVKQKSQAPVLVPKIESPLAMNHLFVGKVQGGRNRLVTHGPRIAASTAPRNNVLTKQLQAVAAAQAASRSKHSPTKHFPTTKNNNPAPRPDQREGEEEKQPQDCLPEETLTGTENANRACDRAPTAPAEKESVSEIHSPEPDTGCTVMEDGKSVVEDDRSAAEDGRSFVEGRSVVEDGRSFVEDEKCKEEADGQEQSHGSYLELATDQETFPPKADDDDSSDSSGDDTSCHAFTLRQLGEEIDCKAFSLDADVDNGIELCPVNSSNAEIKEEGDSGVHLSSPSLDGSGKSSPEKKSPRPISIQLWSESSPCLNGNMTYDCQENTGQGDSNRNSHKSQITIGRCNSAPNGSSHMTIMSMLTPATTPTHTQPTSPSTPSAPTAVSSQLLYSPSHPPPLSSSPLKTVRPFNPFPVKHVNTNRAKTGLKLGLYTPSTLEHIQGQLLGGLVARKARNASS